MNFRKLSEAAVLSRNVAPPEEPPTIDDDGGDDDCFPDRNQLLQWAQQIGWREVGGDFTEKIMAHGSHLKSIRLEYYKPDTKEGLVESTARWIYKGNMPGFADFINEFKSECLSSSLWKSTGINSKCIHDDEFLWVLLDVFAEVKSRMVELWRWQNGHDLEHIKMMLPGYIDTPRAKIELGKPRDKFAGDKSHDGLAVKDSPLGPNIRVKSVLWFPFKVSNHS
jgi:hypothetical protein